MFRRLISILFLVLFFGALPAWFLSTLEGWIFVDCFQRTSAEGMDCAISERFAFASRSLVYSTKSARSLKSFQQGRRGKSVTYQLLLSTPSGEKAVLRSPIGSVEIDRIAMDLNVALQSRATAYHAKINPEPLFWMTLLLFIAFVGFGVFISLQKTIRRKPRK
ncbi:hypothetical protein [Leptospira stimsonii]|uniref:Uncharacterized protein n=1 Tax=Leptospira stimsonii TaxID=2202203 RepID=A0A8B3CP04_9LEPT|nr:hypothetical protein [Leptospira stimsonii]RHX85930.1 hypothetical protein DLM78_08525 [Leptospira stimsonii]